MTPSFASLGRPSFAIIGELTVVMVNYFENQVKLAQDLSFLPSHADLKRYGLDEAQNSYCS